MIYDRSLYIYGDYDMHKCDFMLHSKELGIAAFYNFQYVVHNWNFELLSSSVWLNYYWPFRLIKKNTQITREVIDK